jgi:hypothetical protein
MKTFREFSEQAADALNNIRSLSPYRVMPPLKVPSPIRYLVDPITGFGPKQFPQASVKKQKEKVV